MVRLSCSARKGAAQPAMSRWRTSGGRLQPQAVAQVLAGAAGDRAQAGGRGVEPRQHAIEHVDRHVGAGTEGHQRLALALELLEQVGLEVGPRGDVEDLEQRDQRDVVVERMLAPREGVEAFEQILEPQQGPDAFV